MRGVDCVSQTTVAIKFQDGSSSLIARLCGILATDGQPKLLQGITAFFDRRECFAGRHQRRCLTRERLPAANGDVDIERIEFDRARPAPALVRGNDGRSRPGEGIQYDLPAAGAVLDGVDHQRRRLDRRVHFQVCVAAGPPGVDAGVVPDIGPVASVLAEFDGVHMGAGSTL